MSLYTNKLCNNSHDIKYHNDEVDLRWEEIAAPSNFISFDLDHENLNCEVYYQKIHESNSLLQKQDSLNKDEELNLKNKDDKSKENKFDASNSDYEKKEEKSSTICILDSNTTNFQIKRCEDLDDKEEPMPTSKDSQFDDSLENLKRIIDNKIKGVDKQNRFGRKEDREMFAKIKELCSNRKRNISDFWMVDYNSDLVLQEILSEIHHQTNWRGGNICLLKRIKKLGSKQKFSVREGKLLKNLIQLLLKNDRLDFNKIEYFFPGKNSTVIRKEIGRQLQLL